MAGTPAYQTSAQSLGVILVLIQPRNEGPLCTEHECQLLTVYGVQNRRYL